MSLRTDISIQLVWAIANTEANIAGEKQIRPVHFFLGILKVIDPQFLRQLQGVDLSDEERQQLGNQSKLVRHYLEISNDEITRLRRSLRDCLRKGIRVHEDIHMLHRSAESRDVFRMACDRAVQSGVASISILHLASSLFESGHVSLEELLKPNGRPSSKNARWEVVQDNLQLFADWFGRNLSRLAAEGNLPPFIGRKQELHLIMRVLARTKKRNVAILGNPGVGKTALVDGLAAALPSLKTHDALRHSEILELHGSDIAADCETEAELSRRIMRLFSVLYQNDSAVLLLDDFHGLFPTHLKHDAAIALLTTIMAEGKTPCIITTTTEQWSLLTSKNSSLQRHFHIINLDDPPLDDCREIAFAWAKWLSTIHSVTFSPGAVNAILKGADCLPKDRALPDRVVDLLENAATYIKVSAFSSKAAQTEVTSNIVKAVLIEHYGIDGG